MTEQQIPVLLLSNRLEGGGVERHVSDLRSGLTEHGFHCHIAAACSSAQTAASKDCLHLPLYRGGGERKSLTGLVRSLLLLHRLLRKERIRLVHTHSRYAAFIAFLLRLRHPSLRVLYTAHTAFTDLRWLPFYPRNVICVSAALAEVFRRNTPHPERRNITIIPNGIEHVSQVKEHDAERDADACEFLFVGRLVEQKGLRLLLETATLLKREDGIRIVIRGSGEMEDEVRQAAGERNDGALRCEGYRPEPFTDASKFAALLFPSRDLEGQPYVILEAYAQGLPVLSHDLSALHDLVQDGDTGMIVPEQTAAAWLRCLRDAAADPVKLSMLGRKGRALVGQHHRLDTMLQETAALYTRLLSE